MHSVAFVKSIVASRAIILAASFSGRKVFDKDAKK